MGPSTRGAVVPDACPTVVLVVVTVFVGVTIWLGVRTRRLAAARPGEDFDSFRSSFHPGEVGEDVLRAVFALFQR
jgi:hypothetical protein